MGRPRLTARGAQGSCGPNLFLVGAAKCATTALWVHLGAHPEIHMSSVKEPHFFSRSETPGHPSVRDPAAYARLFESGAARRFRGEASTSYLWDPDSPAAIRRAAPDARIIVSLRDPVERLYSHYWSLSKAGLEHRRFDEAIRAELEGEVDLAAVPPPYVSRGFYAEQLARYLDAFGAAAVIVVYFDELAADVRGTMRGVFERLGLDPEPALRLDPAPRFRFERPRNRAAGLALRVPGLRRLGRRLLPEPLRSRVGRVVIQLEKPPMDPGLRRVLRDVYASHDARLRELLGRPLPWDGRE
jgi:Sulfotransferase family